MAKSHILIDLLYCPKARNDIYIYIYINKASNDIKVYSHCLVYLYKWTINFLLGALY